VRQVSTSYFSEDEIGMVDVKICTLAEEIISMKPEFEHCKRIAKRFGLSLETAVEWYKNKIGINYDIDGDGDSDEMTVIKQ